MPRVWEADAGTVGCAGSPWHAVRGVQVRQEDVPDIAAQWGRALSLGTCDAGGGGLMLYSNWDDIIGNLVWIGLGVAAGGAGVGFLHKGSLLSKIIGSIVPD